MLLCEGCSASQDCDTGQCKNELFVSSIPAPTSFIGKMAKMRLENRPSQNAFQNRVHRFQCCLALCDEVVSGLANPSRHLVWSGRCSSSRPQRKKKAHFLAPTVAPRGGYAPAGPHRPTRQQRIDFSVNYGNQTSAHDWGERLTPKVATIDKRLCVPRKPSKA